MSELQIGLIVVGVLIVAAVYAFNRYQERQLGRGVGRRQADDGSVQRAQAPRAAEAERIEPAFTEAPAAAAKPADSQPIAPAAEAPALAATETLASSSAAGVRDALSADSPIDYVCRLESDTPIEHGLLDAFVKAAAAIGKPVRVSGWNAIASEWIALPCARELPISQLRTVLQLADRSGAANRVQLSSLRDLTRDFAERSGGVCDCPDIDAAAQQAAAIDRFCSQVDLSIGCNVVPRAAGSLAGTKLRGLLESAGFALEPNGRFVLRGEDGQALLVAEDIDGESFSAERLRAGPIAGLTLTMDVPRVAGGARVFERLVELARHLAQGLDGVVVDDNRAELSEAGVKVIRQHLKSVHAAMEAQGIPAGGALAARLFS